MHYLCVYKFRELFTLCYVGALYCVLLHKLDEKLNEYNELDDGSARVHKIQTTLLYYGKLK